MHRLDDPFDAYAVGGVFTRPPDHAVAGDQRTDRPADIAAMHAAVSGFDVGMHAKATDDNAFRRFAKQVVIVVGLLRSGFQTALVVGFDAALLAFGEFIFTQSNWLLVALMGQNLYDTRYFR